MSVCRAANRTANERLAPGREFGACGGVAGHLAAVHAVKTFPLGGEQQLGDSHGDGLLCAGIGQRPAIQGRILIHRREGYPFDGQRGRGAEESQGTVKPDFRDFDRAKRYAIHSDFRLGFVVIARLQSAKRSVATALRGSPQGGPDKRAGEFEGTVGRNGIIHLLTGAASTLFNKVGVRQLAARDLPGSGNSVGQAPAVGRRCNGTRTIGGSGNDWLADGGHGDHRSDDKPSH